MINQRRREAFILAEPTVRIIVGVDDDIRIRESSESLFESAGFPSLLFPSAEEFLRSGKLADTGCLITDIRMPGMDGIELQTRVRQVRPELPLIFISGHFDDENRRRAVAGGAFALIEKPFDPEALLGMIHRAMSGATHG
jgi:FixJ family two-component response regulator